MEATYKAPTPPPEGTVTITLTLAEARILWDVVAYSADEDWKFVTGYEPDAVERDLADPLHNALLAIREVTNK